MFYLNDPSLKRYRSKKLKLILDSVLGQPSIDEEWVGRIYSGIALSVKGTDSPSYLLQRIKDYRVGYISRRLIEEAEKRFQEQCRLGFGRFLCWLARDKPSEEKMKKYYAPASLSKRNFSSGTIESVLGEIINNTSGSYGQIGQAVLKGAEDFYLQEKESKRLRPTHEEYEAILEKLVYLKREINGE